MGALMVYDALQTLGNRLYIRGATLLKVCKCCTSVNKAMPEMSKCCHYFKDYNNISVACHYVAPSTSNVYESVRNSEF